MTKNEFPCRVEGCGTTAFCKGFCKRHYSAARRSGDPVLKTQPPCGHDGCSALSYTRGLCDRHYALARRHKDLEAVSCVVYGCDGATFGHGLCVNHYQKKRRQERRAELSDETRSSDAHMTKECAKCGEVKPHPEFYRRQSVRGSGRSSWCRVCARTNKIIKAYGISPERARELASATSCSSCKDEIPENRFTAVDHCHRTGVVREVLCHPCNVALGLLHEDSDKIMALARYAEKWTLALRDTPDRAVSC